MQSNFVRRVGLSVAAVSGVVLAAAFFTTSRAQADDWDKMTLLTTTQPMQVYNTYLDPGTYMFKLMSSQSDRHVVQIFNQDRTHLYTTILAIPNYQLNPANDSEFLFYETPQGSVKALRAWFYPGDNFGQEFRYPTDLRQVAYNAPAPALITPPAAPALTEPQADLIPPPIADSVDTAQAQTDQVQLSQNQSVGQDQGIDQDQDVNQDQNLVAQNNPPSPSASVQDQSSPVQASQDQSSQDQIPSDNNSLPQTASPYPIIGLSGLFALGLYFGLRVQQTR